ncbi:MAG: MFS transporter [Burkholderiaceae bacterium]
MWQLLNSAQRRQLATVLGLGLLYGFVLGSQFYVPRLVHVLHGSATAAGLLLALSLVPVFLVALLGRRIAARWTPQQVLRMGLACHVGQLLLLAVSPNLLILIPAMILGGFGYGFSFAKLLNSATGLMPKSHYAQGIAYFSLAVQLGVGISSGISAAVEPLTGTQGLFWIPLLLAVVGVLLAALLPEQQPTPDAAPGAIIHGRKNGNMFEAMLLMGVLGLTFGLPLQFVPMWLSQSPLMSFSPGYFLTTSFFSIMMTRLLFGHLLSSPHEMRVVLVCFTIVSLAVAVLGAAHTPLQFVACAVAYGSAYSLLYPSCAAYLFKQVEPEDRGAWSNWVLLGYEVGSRCLPAVFGIVADLGGFPLTFKLLGVVIALVGIWHLVKRFYVPHSMEAALIKKAV